MLITDSVEQFDSGIEATFAFRITGEVQSEDLEAMAEVMNRAFDRTPKVDMLVVFKSDEGSEFGAGIRPEVMKSQFRALFQVRNYCVVKAPEAAATLIEVFDNIVPLDARTFESEHNALEYLRAQPRLDARAA